MADEIEYDFDAIVVGGGMSGNIAAYTLATAGKSVLVVERGNYSGAKNMTGGRLYAHSLKKVFPDFESEAPVQRKITHEKISLINEKGNFTVDFTDPVLGEEGKDSYSILRAPFDQWLSEKAEEAGAEMIPGIAVEDLIKKDGKICGINAAGEEMTAKVVLLCDGANSLLIQKAGLTTKVAPNPSDIAVGAKEIIELPANVIEDRFNLVPGEGAAWMFAGDCTKGKVGGVFLYTNQDSISLGVVSTLSELVKGDKPIYQMLEDFKNRADIAPLIKDGKMVEYSGHLVPEGGYNMVCDLAGDGVLVAGDAAGLCINSGYSVRGMDLAVASGQMAAEAAIKAIDAGDYSKNGLASYITEMNNSFVMKDLQVTKDFPAYMEWNNRIFDTYPDMIRDIFLQMFSFDGTPQIPMKQKIMPIVKKVGLFKLLKDVQKGMKAL